jgi:hypothetical protein
MQISYTDLLVFERYFPGFLNALKEEDLQYAGEALFDTFATVAMLSQMQEAQVKGLTKFEVDVSEELRKVGSVLRRLQTRLDELQKDLLEPTDPWPAGRPDPNEDGA